MPRYNIALLPIEKKIHDLFVDLAQSYFVANADGYLLGENALAHVTLCQFHAQTETVAREAFASLVDKTNEPLYIEEFNFRSGRAEHDNFFWAEFLIRKTPALLKRQREVAAQIADRKLETFTPVVAYEPHLTLARITHTPDEKPALKNILPAQPVVFRPVIGVSTPNGVLERELK